MPLTFFVPLCLAIIFLGLLGVDSDNPIGAALCFSIAAAMCLAEAGVLVG
jgi:hypothetical protein